MPRPAKRRIVGHLPHFSLFVPIAEETLGPGRRGPLNLPLQTANAVQLTIAELEGLRLKHFVGLVQKEAAKRMHVSQSTFSRILDSAHTKITQALVEGRAVRIEGGSYRKIFRGFGCLACGHEWETKDTSEDRSATACPACQSTQVYKLSK